MTILQDNLRKIYQYCDEEAAKDDVQKGWPTSKEQKAGLPKEPGVGKATWCNRYIHRILDHFGYDVDILYEKNPYTDKPSINWTTANHICTNARIGAIQGIIQPLSEQEAVEKANEGHIPFCCWKNPHGSGHVAIVASGKYDPVRGASIFQAGEWNGFFHRKDKKAFGNRKRIEFYLLPKKRNI
jgi:hypothetical protein